jgi:N-acetylglucosaminyl-diphospho-decaprenol L-rhamnosyltransferase
MITLSIVSHNQKHLVHELISDLVRINSALVSHVILTHNSCDDRIEFAAAGKHLPLTQIFNKTPKGFGENHNAAFQICDEPFFTVLNPDLRLVADPFEVLIASFENKECGLVAPVVLAPDGSVENSARQLYTPMSVLLKSRRRYKLAGDPAWLAGMFLMFRSEAFRAIGGFDEKFFMYVEDVDICARLALSGRALQYVKQVSVIHDAQRANRKSLRHFSWHLASAMKWWLSRTFWRYKKKLS